MGPPLAAGLLAAGTGFS